MLDNLPAEILDIVFMLCDRHSAFVALTCQSLQLAEIRNRVGATRRCAVYSAFQTMETLNYAMSQNRFKVLVQNKKLEWTALAKYAALKSGSREVVQSVCPDLTTNPAMALSHISRWNRIDVLFEPMNQCLVDWIDVEVGKWASPSRSLSSSVVGAMRLVTSVVVPALCGGSINVLDFVFDNMRRRRLSHDCVWNTLISGEARSAPALMAVAAATSEDATHSLEYLCELLVDVVGTYTIETVRRHVAAVGLVMSKTSITQTALEWCKKRASSLSCLIHGFNHDIKSGILIVPVKQEYISVFRECFHPRLVTSYNFLHRETKSGGWMHNTFYELKGCKTSCMAWETVSVTNSIAFGDIDTVEKYKLVVASLEDCFASVTKQSAPTHAVWICRQMDTLSRKSVHASYTVARRVIPPHVKWMSSTACPMHDVVYYVFYGKGCILYVILLRAVYTGLVAVVKDLLGQRFNTGLHLNSVQHDNVLTVALHCDNKTMIDVILSSGHFHPTMYMAMRAASQQRANFLDSALKFNTELVHPNIAKAAYTTQNASCIHVAVIHGCFADSPLDFKSYDATSTFNNKKRRLPTDFLLGSLLRSCQSKA